MRALVAAAGLTILLLSSSAQATDVINQDRRPYTIRVQGEGKLGISTHTVRAGGSIYGLCNYSFCTFQIARHKVAATRNARLLIRGGRFTK